MRQLFEGRIDLIIGPMFSGKSSELQRIVRRYNIANKTCVIVNYYLDSRYIQGDLAITHDK